MSVLRLALLTLAACAAGCATSPPGPATHPGRTLLASILIVESSHHGPVRRKTGFEFHVSLATAGVAGPFLEGERYRDGRLVDSFDGGSGSAEVIEAIERVGLAPFDFEREESEVVARLKEEARKRGEEYLVGGSRDAATWEIIVVTRNGRFSVRAPDPGGTFDLYAPHSENFAKLKAVIDLLAQYYGRLEFGL